MARRDFVVLTVAALLATAWLALPMMDRLNGLSLDTLFWLRDLTFGTRHAVSSSPTAIIAIDEETYRQPPFKDLPSAMWTPQFARVLEMTLDGGATVVGFDVIMPISIEKHIPGFDREFRLALNHAAAEGKVVLSKIQHRHEPISPFPAYSFAVGHQQNIRGVNLNEDLDGVIRRVPLTFRSDDLHAGVRVDPSLALEIAARAIGVSAQIMPTGLVKLGDYTIPGSATRGMLVNFDGDQQIPVYSLADLYACAQAGNSDYFRSHFSGKAILIGATLDVEDLWLTSKRFIPAPDGSGLAPRCMLQIPEGFYDPTRRRDRMPGVFIHAQAVNDLVRREVLFEPIGWQIAFCFVLVTGTGLITLSQSPLRTGAWLIAGALGWTLVATVFFKFNTVFPLFDPLVGGALAYVGLLGYRFAITERSGRHLRQVFAYYLPAMVIDRMTAPHHRPTLGGEVRELTVWFSDIQGFAHLAEGLSPPELVSLLNAYLAELTDIIEKYGGFIDKYMGDGVIAVFGAPVEDPDHARHAVQAARACQDRFAGRETVCNILGGRHLKTRIGINTGQMLVGNIGSPRRLNYTVMGDSVNLAARLENANKLYGTSVLVSEATKQACGPAFVFREVDCVRVAGRHSPVRIFEPLTTADSMDTEQQSLTQRFAAALSDYRARRFEHAAASFAALASKDYVSASFARRAAEFASNPPPADWDAITDLEHK